VSEDDVEVGTFGGWRAVLNKRSRVLKFYEGSKYITSAGVDEPIMAGTPVRREALKVLGEQG
jgi:hypothetical protein